MVKQSSLPVIGSSYILNKRMLKNAERGQRFVFRKHPLAHKNRHATHPVMSMSVKTMITVMSIAPSKTYTDMFDIGFLVTNDAGTVVTCYTSDLDFRYNFRKA